MGWLRTLATGLTVALVSAPTLALDDAHRELGARVAQRAIDYLRTQQDEASGGWCVHPNAPPLPGISAIVLQGMLLEPALDADDQAIAAGLRYLTSLQQEDGSIHGGLLPSYNTALSLSALAAADEERYAETLRAGSAFLAGAQWAGQEDDEGRTVDAAHPFYGGMGYGSHARPDLSNLAIGLQALHDAGVEGGEEAFQRALTFLERTQMLDEVNDQAYADGSRQGGFIYATSTDSEHLGNGESKAGAIEETIGEGRAVSRLRCYGSMTYAGFKSYLYADLDQDDPRVVAAYGWIQRHYTVLENPGIGLEGYYYYLLTMSKALSAAGVDHLTTLTPEGSPGQTADWANDLIARLATLQQEDGSLPVLNDRWMEDNPVLITAYSLLAVQHALGRDEAPRATPQRG
ncbi:MAG: prenyltransferase/squalene oxidase repeat-containing protein [Phycisphaerales bacterium JB038]